MRLHIYPLSTLLVALALTAGCASQRIQVVDDAFLSEVSPEQKRLVHQARDKHYEATDALAKATRDSAWAKDQAELTRAELKSIEKELEEAELAMNLAEQNGTATELDLSKTRFEYLTAKADATREKLALRKREYEHSQLLQKVALERDRLAAAEVELAKARAVQELDRVAAKQISLREYEMQVIFHRTEVALAEVRAEGAAERVAIARQDFGTAEAKAASYQVEAKAASFQKD